MAIYTPYTYLSVTWLGEQIRQMQNNKFDAVIVFDGSRGLGKSTAAINLAYATVGKNFRMKRDICFTREDVMKQLAQKEAGIIIADEMINVTFNRDFYAEDQKKLIKMLNMYRDRRNILICCVPKFSALDKQFLQLVKLRINIISRGSAVLHKHRKGSYSEDSWDMQVNERIERKWMMRGVVKPNYRRLTTFCAMMRLHALTEKRERIYQQIKDEKRNLIYDVIDEEKENEMEKNENLFNYIYSRFTSGDPLSVEEFRKTSALIGKDYNKIRQALRYILDKRGLALKFSDLVPTQVRKNHQARVIAIGQSQNIPITKII